MKNAAPSQRVLRFGPFDFDPQSSTLRKNGVKVVLQKQPADLLCILMERPGEVVSREELRDRLWPGKEFGDFDVGLNKAVLRLREALGDSAQAPHYIETLPQHGYRFMVRVAEARNVQGRRRAFLIAILAAGVLTASLVSAYFGWHFPRGTAPGPINALAVLPFANLSGDPGQEYFADGVTDALITEIGKIGAFRVISRQSTLKYKKGDQPLREISRELRVDAILEGTVVRAGDRVRITAQLLRAQPEQHLWAESYERNYSDILTVQKEIAESVARQVRAKLKPENDFQRARQRRINQEAHEAYLRGRYYFYGYTPDRFQKSMESLETAVAKDPGLAEAWAMLSIAYGSRAYWGFVRPRDLIPKAGAAARKAVELDENLSDARYSAAMYAAFSEWNWEAAENEFKRAIELNPNNVSAHGNYGLMLVSLRRFSEGMEQFQIARELDPHPPVRSSMLATCSYLSGEYEKSASHLGYIIETAPDFFISRRLNWRVQFRLGRLAAALAQCRRMYELMGDAEVRRALDEGERRSGYAGAMKAAAEALERRSDSTYVAGSEVATLYVHAGEHGRALKWLDRALEDGDPLLHLVWADPCWEPLYDNQRFQNILRRMGFPSVERAAEWTAKVP